MQSPLTLLQLHNELERRKSAKRDMIADTRALALSATTGALELLDCPFNLGDVILPRIREELAVNDIAHGQIASRLDMPLKYYNRMRTEAPALLADNVNHWFRAKPENRMVRTLDGKVRAFLSDRYQRIENDEIAGATLPDLLALPGVNILSCDITESRMYIKAVFTKVEGEVAKGDVVQSGVIISNSEVGQGAVSIKPLVYRLACLNGLILEDSKYSARHVGGRITAEESIREMLSDEALQADDRAILLKVRDVVRASYNEARFAEQLDKMRAAAGEKLMGDPAQAIKVLGKKVSLNEAEQSAVLRHLIEGHDLSRWGVLNAVTRSAQDVEDYDRATELEATGGVILNFPKTDWEQVAMAA